MVIFTILMSVLAPASPVPNPNCRIIFHHDDVDRQDTQQVVIRALADQKAGPCQNRMLAPEDSLGQCVPLTPVDVERINRRLSLKGLPRDTTLDANELNANAHQLTIATLVDRMMSNWDKLYCTNGEYR